MEFLQKYNVLKERNFLFLLTGQTIASIGVPFTMIAISWFVYDITGSTLALGGVLLAYNIPLAILHLFSGTFIDRWDRKQTMVIIEFIRVLVLLVPIVLYWLNSLEIWHLYIVNAILGISEAFFKPAVFATIPKLIKSEQTVQANGILSAGMTSSNLIGPVLAGVIVAVFGAPFAILVNAITFFVSGILLMFLPRSKPAARKEKRFFKEVSQGFIFFKDYVGLLWLLALASITNFALGVMVVLMLPYAVDILKIGTEGYGLMQSFLGVGLLIGSLVATLLVKFSKRNILLTSHIIAGFFIFSLWYSPFFYFTLIFIVGYGLSVAIWNTYSNSVYHQLVPNEVMGRVQSVRLLMSQGTNPLGMAVGAVVGEAIGFQNTFFLLGAIVMLTGVTALLIRSIKIVDKDIDEPVRVI